MRLRSGLPMLEVQAMPVVGTTAVTVQTSCVPLAMGQMLFAARPETAWGQVVTMMPSCASFGQSGCQEMLIERLEERRVAVEPQRAKNLVRRQVTHTSACRVVNLCQTSKTRAPAATHGRKRAS